MRAEAAAMVGDDEDATNHAYEDDDTDDGGEAPKHHRIQRAIPTNRCTAIHALRNVSTERRLALPRSASHQLPQTSSRLSSQLPPFFRAPPSPYASTTDTPFIVLTTTQAPPAASPSGRKSSPATSQTRLRRATLARSSASPCSRTTMNVYTTRRRCDSPLSFNTLFTLPVPTANEWMDVY